MKKLLLSLGLMSCSLAFFSCSSDDDNDKTIQVSSLPSVAQQFITSHFANSSVSKVTEDNDSYDVLFSNGDEVDFDKTGSWNDVKCSGGVPASIMALVPANIQTYVTSTYPNNKIVEISKESYGYDVELNNGTDLIFDASGNFQRIDK